MKKCLLYIFLTLFIFSTKAQSSFYKPIIKFAQSRETSYQKIDVFFKDYTLDINKLNTIIAEAKKYNALEIELYSKLKQGVLLRDKAYYQEALKINADVLKAAKKNHNLEFEIVALNMQGVVYRRLDSIRLATNYHQKALELAENRKHKNETILRNIAISCNSIGNIYLTLDQFDLAKEKFEKALVIEKKIGNNLGLAINHQNIGGIYEKKNELDKALAAYYLSLKYNEIINSDVGKLICYNSLGQVFLKQNKINKAEYYLKDVISSSLKTEDDFYISSSYLNVGWLNLKKSNFNLAKEHLLKCIKIAKEKKLQSILIDAYKILSQIEEKEGNNQQALTYYKNYQKVKEDIINEKNLKYINELNTKYNTQKRQAELKFLKQENNFVKERLKNTYLNYFVVILLALLVIGIIYIYQRQKQLTSEKKLLLIEQKMFRAQLNPHFIFNALNSIKSYIIKNEKDKAVYYLNKFSKLFNVILSGINEREVTLAEELKIIEIYIKLENIRFDNSIQFSLTIDNDIQLQQIKIPSLLLQPYVENAIWHGLNSMKGEKKLMINVSKSNEKIVITIQDNGIGIVKAQELKKQRATNRESFGLKLTKERLQSYYNNTYTLKTINLYDSNGTACGTQIVLEIPEASTEA